MCRRRDCQPLAINAASLSTQISGLPFSGPAGAVRIALIDDQWVAFPKYSDKERAVFDMVVAGRNVVAADGSDDSDRALHWAAEQAFRDASAVALALAIGAATLCPSSTTTVFSSGSFMR